MKKNTNAASTNGRGDARAVRTGRAALRDELRWTPTPVEARRRMESRPGFLERYSKEQIDALFSGALDPDL